MLFRTVQEKPGLSANAHSLDFANINYLLKEIYKYPYSFSSFDIWIYRAKQIGIFHVTEFYPGFNGRILYPTSILANNVISDDFENVFEYKNGESLFIHSPNTNNEKNMEDFVKELANSYIDAKETHGNYFTSLADLRERVCYKLKFSAFIFDRFLENAYKLNLQGKLRINIY